MQGSAGFGSLVANSLRTYHRMNAIKLAIKKTVKGPRIIELSHFIFGFFSFKQMYNRIK